MKAGKRVLIVDGASSSKGSMASLLSEIGCTVVAEADSGKAAADRFREVRPDIVTMNLAMPGGGISALKGLLEAEPEANVIVISGLHQKALLMDALDAGAKDFLIEPFDKGELQEVTERI